MQGWRALGSFIEWVWELTVLHGARSTLLTTLSSVPGTQLVPNECLFTESPGLSVEPGTQLVLVNVYGQETEKGSEGLKERRAWGRIKGTQTSTRWHSELQFGTWV